MPSIKFDVWCSCGNFLDAKDVKGGIEIELCEKCLEEVRRKSYDEAYESGHNDGYNKAYDELNDASIT